MQTQEFESTQLGKVSIQPKNILFFPKGIPGFENCCEWHLFHEDKESQPIVYWLQSLDQPDILFNVIHPAHADLEYVIELNEEEEKLLGVEPEHELGVLVMLSRSSSQQSIRALTDAPLVINLSTQKGMQKAGLTYHLLVQSEG
jgi:flagellar assembly factor FliW